MIDFTEGLNDSQKIAVLTTDGPLLIVAGAGAGKTKTVVHRIGHLITKGVSPQAILAVTFTNKAAKEMRERTKTMIQKTSFVFQEHQLPFVSTFHSLGVFILRRFGAFNGTVKKFTMLDDSDSTAIIKEAFQSYGMDPKEHDPRGVKSAISRFANACTDPESLMSDSNPKNRITAKIWKKYISLKREQHALDFDDLLLQTAALLEQDQTVRAWCNETWTHVHIDEYQDTNEVQYRIARALAAKTKNLCVVGDSDQSIYSWRGANIKNILEFEKDYPEATVVLLEENYRSTKNVIEVANTIITKNNYRTEKKLFTNNALGEKLSLYTAYDETDEASFIVERTIEQLDRGIPPEEIAVLFRTNFQSRALEEAFLTHSIPYQVLGVKFFERKEIKDVLSYVRAALNPESLVDIKRIINIPARGIGKVTIAKVFSEGKESLTGKAKISVDGFYSLLDRIRNFIETHTVSETIQYIITESGMLTAYTAEGVEGQERLENLKELVTLAVRYDGMINQDGGMVTTEEALEKIVEEATLMSDQDTIAQGVKLMTIHASKGLEFAVVFITGLEQGLFPHQKDSTLSGADAEEERRLMYVAVTRARQKLFLTYASVRTIFGMRDIRMPSEFLMDIPDALIERESRKGESGFTVFL